MTFVGELHAALERPHRGESADAVHDLIGNALRRLDPAADIKRTHYFTHTFVPDIVLRWNDDGIRKERHVHLRFSVTAPVFQQDLDLLSSESPLFIGMTDREGLDAPAWAGGDTSTNGSLVTQGQAVDDLDSTTRVDHRVRGATGPIVRVGHGILDATRAEQVGGSYMDALQAVDAMAVDLVAAQEHVAGALATLHDYLPEHGQLEVERGLQSEWIRRGGDPYEFPSSTPWNPELLDIGALREVLVSLLASANPVEPETWQRNAGFITAEDLGRVLGRNLRGGTFNNMARALLPNWTAKWAWSERLPSPPLEDTYEWLVDNGLVGIEVNDLRTFFADDGRHFKDKEGGNPLPMLSDAQPMLSQRGLLQVGLRGRLEGIRYEPLANASDVFERIRQILSAPGAGGYRIQSVRTLVPGVDSVAEIDLDRQIFDLGGRSTPVSTLARMANRFFSRATRPEGLDHFLATGEAPTAREVDAA